MGGAGAAEWPLSASGQISEKMGAVREPTPAAVKRSEGQAALGPRCCPHTASGGLLGIALPRGQRCSAGPVATGYSPWLAAPGPAAAPPPPAIAQQANYFTGEEEEKNLLYFSSKNNNSR